MKPKPCRNRAGLNRLLLASFLIAAATSAQAQTTYVWDAGGDASTETGGSGTWDSSSTLWRNGSDIGALEAWPNTDPNADAAQFLGTAGTVTLNSDSVNLNFRLMLFGTTEYVIAAPASGTATLNVSGTSPARITTNDNVSATISAGISGASTITLNKAGAGTLTLSGANTYTGVTTVSSGTTTAGGITNVSGDQSAADGGWSILGVSTVNFLSDSTIVMGAGKDLTFANGGTAGGRSLNVAGTVTSSGRVFVRGRASLNINSGAEWTQNGRLIINPSNAGYTANMTVRTGGSFTYNNNSLDIALAKSTDSNNGSANLTLAGGTFTTSRGFTNADAGSNVNASTNLILNSGGTLKLSTDIPLLIIEKVGSPFGVFTNNTESNTVGGVIDTNSFSTTVPVAILGTGSLTKAGAGTLTLSGINTYAGNTTVTGGTLVLAAINASNDLSMVTIGDSGVLQLTYEGSDTVDKLFIGAIQQAAGVYGHTSTGADNGGLGVGALDARFAEGTGTLTVVTSPISTSPFQDFMAAYPGLTGDDALPGADPDADGVSNLGEFIMGGSAPNSGSAANRPVEAVISDHLTMSILVPTGATFAGSPSPSATVQGVQVTVGGSLDLSTFARPVEATVLNPGLPSAPSGYNWHTFRLGEAISSQSRGFLRASFIAP